MNTRTALIRAGHLLVGLPLLITPGCSSSHLFDLDALSRDGHVIAAAPSYHIVAADHNGRPELCRVIENSIRAALSARGMFECIPGDLPDQIIEYAVGISGPHLTTQTRSEPVYRSVELAASADGAGAPGVVDQFDGIRLVSEEVAVFRKSLRLTARAAVPASPGGSAPHLWTVHVQNQDESNDLERYVVLMAAAAIDSIGSNSRSRQRVNITERDGRVLLIEAGAP